MGNIHCCGGLRKCKSYRIIPTSGFFVATLNMLETCPVCGHKVVLLARIDMNHDYSEVRKVNQKAQKLFDKLKTSILYTLEREFCANLPSANYLRYGDNGIKKCYSSLSSLKLGLFESLNLPAKPPEKLDLRGCNLKK